MCGAKSSNAWVNAADQICKAAAKRSTRLPGGIVSLGDLATGEVELSLYLLGEFELILKIVLNPIAESFDFPTG